MYCLMNSQLSLKQRKAIQHTSSGQAPGSDAIPAEIYKAGCQTMAEKLTGVVSSHVEEGGYPTRITSRKEMLKSVTSIETSLYCRLLGRY